VSETIFVFEIVTEDKVLQVVQRLTVKQTVLLFNQLVGTTEYIKCALAHH